MTEESVKVAVRVRPFNQREKDRNAKLTIKMQGQTTIIINPENAADEKKFAFDYSYWSHDGCKENSEGILEPENSSSKYASQQKVFDDLGKGVLENAFNGYNCSLFAYGQTGSGKSYSMVGYGANKGIVPITCEELFKSIMENKDPKKRFEVTFSMLEIYNEQVRDLLSKEIPKGGLQVRQSPALGFYVQGLKRIPVGSYKDIEKRMEQGTSNRTVAATNMNATSSRAHTVVSVTFDQIIMADDGGNKKSSVMNLVDLAGSERADSTGATGDRLKEGANINRSLSALGNVISALAELSSGKNKKIIVPYRDSVLTKLLQNALGGNSKTVMIAALSPADINYDETLSTLRYADRAKQIKNTCVVNENPMDKLIRELREENERLKLALQHGNTSGMSPEELQKMRQQIEEELTANMELMTVGSEGDWEKKLAEARNEVVVEVQVDRRKTETHLSNLNEDPQLSGVILHYMTKDSVTIGRESSTEKPDISLKGLSISVKHANLKKDSKTGKWSISQASIGSVTLVNGIQLVGSLALNHNDRILFGSNHLYVFKNPLNTECDPKLPETIDWDYAQAEIARAKGFDTKSEGLTMEQQVLQNQIIEILPLVNEVNCISEELDKKRSFEVNLMSDNMMEGTTGVKSTTKLYVKMKHLTNGNTWIWERGKFLSRRYIMQELYQKYLDGEDISKIKPEDDPFWEPAEEVIIGVASAYLRALSYCLDVDDRLKVLDYKGGEEGVLHITITPCTQAGRPLGDDTDVEDPHQLLNKPYYIKITIKTAEVFKSRFNRGIRVRYRVFNEDKWIETPVQKGTLDPKFDHTHTYAIGKVTKEHLDFFEKSCIPFIVLGVQEDKEGDKKLAKLSTKELRELDRANADKEAAAKNNPDSLNDVTKLKAEMATFQKKLERHEERERRLQNLCTELALRPEKERDFQEFYRSVAAIVHTSGTKFKTVAEVITTIMKSPNKGLLSSTPMRARSATSLRPNNESSKACNIM